MESLTPIILDREQIPDHERLPRNPYLWKLFEIIKNELKIPHKQTLNVTEIT